jgi:Asp-tRNA(Asn)/Glu-tRNA(Gln) amidotransferase A subunit family amidase
MASAAALNTLSVYEASSAIARGQLTSEALTRACLERIAAREPVVHAWARIDADAALAEARQRDEEPSRGPLHGVPIGVKDVLNTANMTTEMGSPIYAGHRTRSDAASVALLRSAGAVVLGKTITCEFAGVEPGPTTNPIDAARTPGGSSSGSGAAVADGMAPAALGTQTGGSVLRPASFCGVVGFKPTYGRISREGMKFAAESLDTIGVIARTPNDAALVVDAMAGRLSPAPSRFETPPRLALCRTHLWDEKASPETRVAVATTVDLARRAGASVFELDTPSIFSRLSRSREVINDVERARSLAWEWANHRELLSERMRAIVARGFEISEAAYDDELMFAEAGRITFDELARGFDAMITPCVNGEAPVGLSYAGDPSFQGLWTLLHVPAIAIPATRGPNGMPVGIQIVGSRRSDRRLVAIATWLRSIGVGRESEKV